MKHQHLFRFGRLAILYLGLFGFFFSSQPTLAGPESGQSAHYIVFEKHGDGTIVPVYYRPVQLSAPLRSASDSQLIDYLAQPSRNAERIVVALQAEDESIVYQDVVDVSPWLRGEFHGEAAGDPIDGHILPAENPAFVVRVPRDESDLRPLPRGERDAIEERLGTEFITGREELLRRVSAVRTGSELWRPLLLLAVALACFEILVAARWHTIPNLRRPKRSGAQRSLAAG